MSERRNPLAGMKIAKVTSRAISRDEEVTRRAPANMGSSAFLTGGRPTSEAQQFQSVGATPSKQSAPYMSTGTNQLKLGPIRKQNIIGQIKEEELQQSRWKPAEASVRPVPRFFPLENTSAVLVGVAPGVVAARIAQCCRVLSTEATFDDNTATAKLRTMEHVEIHVALWRGSGPPRYPEKCLFVELQRCAGDVLVFSRYARHLLSAAKGNFDAASFQADQKEQKRRLSSWTAGSRKSNRNESEEKHHAEEDTNHLSSVVENSYSLLKSEGAEEQLVALELISVYSDCAKVDETTAAALSEAILRGYFIPPYSEGQTTPSNGKLQRIQQDILSFVSPLTNEPEEDDNDDDWFSDLGIENDDPKVSEMLRCSSLRILFNVFHNLKMAKGEGIDVDMILREWAGSEGRDLLSDLVTIIDGAERKTHEAYLATRILLSLSELSPEVLKRLNNGEGGLLDTKSRLDAAFKVGQRSHAKLESEAENLIGALRNKIM